MYQNPYAGLDTAQYTEKGIYLPPDWAGEIEIVKCEAKRTQLKGDMTFIHFKLLSSNMPQEHAAGEIRQFCQDMRNLPVAFGQLKAVLVGLSGQRYDHVDPGYVQKLPDIMAAAVDQRQLLAGYRCALHTSAKPAKAGAKVEFYTSYAWSPAPSLGGADQGSQILAKLAGSPQPQAYPAAPPPVAPPPVGGNPWAAQPPPPPPAPPAPPPPAAPAQPWAGRPIQNGHYLKADNSAWIPLPPGVTG